MIRLKVSVTVLLVAVAVLSAHAQTGKFTLKGSIKGAGALPTSIFLMPVDRQGTDSIVVHNDKVEGMVGDSLRGLCRLVGVVGQRQIILPVWIDGKTRLQLSLDADGCLTNKSDADNRALSAFNEDIYRRSRALWETSQQTTPEEAKTMAGGYLTVADSLVSKLKPNSEVAAYLHAWAYTQAAAFWITRYPKSPLPWAAASTMLDNKVAAVFYDTPRIILHTLPHDSLGARLDYLYGHYQTPALRRLVGTTLVQQFIRKYDYSKVLLSGKTQIP